MEHDKISKEASTHGVTGASLQEQIRKRAYELYLARDGAPGDALQDWVQAEAEIAWKCTH